MAGLLYGLHMEHQGSGAAIPHILSYLTTRTVADDGVFEVRKGSLVGTRVFRITMEGQIQGQDGTLAKPTYSFASDKTTGLHYVGAANVGVVISGVKVVDYSAGAVAVTGTLAASGNVAINTNKFTVTAASGNTLVAGTFNATGIATFAGGLDGVIGAVTPAAGTFTALNATGGGALTGTWTNLGAVTTVDINGGTVGGVTLDGTISGTPTWASTQSLNTSGLAATATALATARAINGVNFDGTAAITVTAAAGTLSGTVLAAAVVTSSLTTIGTLVAGAVPANLVTAATFAAGTYSFSGSTIANLGTVSAATSITSTAFAGPLTGNADTATALATARAINGVNFDGTAAITVTAAASTLSGATLAAGVTASSLTSLGTLTALAVNGITTLNGVTPSAWASPLASVIEGGAAGVASSSIYFQTNASGIAMSANYYYDGTERFKLAGDASQIYSTGTTTYVRYATGSAGGAITWTNLQTWIATGTAITGTLAISGNIGFFGQAVTAKPTGVAVSAAGIHAALVTLNLIAA